MFLFRGGSEMRNASPAEQQAGMMKWKVWMDGIAAQGESVGGEPLHYGDGKVLSGRAKKITDGPFAEAKEIVGRIPDRGGGQPERSGGAGQGLPDLRERRQLGGAHNHADVRSLDAHE